MLDKDLDNDLDLDDEDETGEGAGLRQATLAGLIPQPDPHASTPLELARMGVAEFAYIRRNIVNDVPMWTIHSAAGDPLGAAETFDLAWAAVKQNDLQPMWVN